MKRLLITLWEIIYPQAIYAAVSLVVQSAVLGILCAIQLFTGSISAREIFTNNVLVLTGLAAFFSIPILFFVYRINKKKENVRTVISSPDIPTYAACIIGAAGAAIICNIITAFLFAGFEDAAFDSVTRIIYSSSTLVAFFAAVLLGPIAEELIFRGIIYRRVAYRCSPLLGIIISSIAFGIFHGNITQGSYAIMMGLVLSIAYFVTDRISICMLMHIAANLSSLLSSAILEGDGAGAAAAYIALILISALGVVLMIYMLKRHYKNSRREIKEYETT